jgi:hypothetical protein
MPDNQTLPINRIIWAFVWVDNRCTVYGPCLKNDIGAARFYGALMAAGILPTTIATQLLKYNHETNDRSLSKMLCTADLRNTVHLNVEYKENVASEMLSSGAWEDLVWVVRIPVLNGDDGDIDYIASAFVQGEDMRQFRFRYETFTKKQDAEDRANELLKLYEGKSGIKRSSIESSESGFLFLEQEPFIPENRSLICYTWFGNNEDPREDLIVVLSKKYEVRPR